ncbi:MAG: GIY-YIG nuclease family protein [candidate division Zixibacteria bacterium]|nr:GIY-YIG nuclease family protein [candidate division Zixibacteria bacterium]
MNLNNLLRGQDIDPKHVLVLRHRPKEPKLNKVLPWLAVEKPDLFNAYQKAQAERLEKAMQAMTGVGYIASFIGHVPGKAVFVGLYSIKGSEPLTYEEYWQIPANKELKAFGMEWWKTREASRSHVLWFNLTLTDFYSHWKGRLIVDWPGRELAWWRRAHRKDIPIFAVLEDNALAGTMPEWNVIDLAWEELRLLPTLWKLKLSEWRGIYYIFDASDGKGYVGSAYGKSNILGRWESYATAGHGENRLLRKRDPRNFRFTILQRVSPDMDPNEVIRLEGSWKQRLHTRAPQGLNDN